MRSINHTLRTVPAALALLSLAAACSKDAAADASNPKSAGGSVQQADAGAGGARGGAGAGGRPSPSITLAPTDVATVTATTIEDGVALTGDLRPSETIDVRSRIE